MEMPRARAQPSPPRSSRRRNQPIRRSLSLRSFVQGSTSSASTRSSRDKAGNSVNDLQQADFDVLEDGKPQKIDTFKLIKLDGGVQDAIKEPPKEIRTDYDEEAEAARDDVRLFAIFLDDYHVRRGSSMSVRKQLATFVDTQMGPTDMLGVMYPLESTASVRMTRNHAAVSRGLEQFTGRKYDYEPKNQYEEQYAYYPAETVEQIRNQVSLSALESADRAHGHAEGGAEVAAARQRRLHHDSAAADAHSECASAGPRGHDQSDRRRRRHQRGARQLAGLARHGIRAPRCLRHREQEQRVDLRGRSARSAGVRVRHQRGRRAADRFAVSEQHHGYLARALRKHRRPRHRQPQRHRDRDETDHPRRQRLLPDRLQLVAGADRREVPRHQSPSEAAGRAGARP